MVGRDFNTVLQLCECKFLWTSWPQRLKYRIKHWATWWWDKRKKSDWTAQFIATPGGVGAALGRTWGATGGVMERPAPVCCIKPKQFPYLVSWQLLLFPPHSRQEEGHFQPPGDVQEGALQGAAVEVTAKVLLGAACSLSNPSIQPWMHYQTHSAQGFKRETISLLISLLPLHILNFAFPVVIQFVCSGHAVFSEVW